ncbi:cytochrome P450 [Hymenopellis radicata]|nr:cytochrome P450 [Hymenopellis radicata]
MTMDQPSFIIVSLVAVVVYYIFTLGRRENTLPPGPPTLPVLGNLLQFPKDNIYIKLTDWAKEYGGFYSLKLGPQTLIVISNPRDCDYGGPTPNYFMDQVTHGKHTAFARYSTDWKKSRRIISEWFNKDACSRRLPIQQAEIAQLLSDLAHNPKDFFPSTYRYSNSVITSILAGVRSPRHDSLLVTLVHRMMHKWSIFAEPATQPPLDLIPLLRYVPERWASWKPATRQLRSIQHNIYDSIVEVCKARIRRDASNGSALDEVLPTCEERGIDESLLRGIIASIFEGATGTTADYIRILILFLVKHPEVQTKAQKEIDAIVGCDRCPVLSDFERLPYAQALVREITRIHPVATLSAPHYVMQDEVYNGFVIPKHAWILVNIYGIFHDPDAYEDPEKFNPDRYLLSEFGTKSGADNTGRRADLQFGAGRRICGGMNLANNSMALSTMNLLWAFRFSEAIDPKSGKVIPVDLDDFEKGLTAGPKPFQCDINVRTAGHAAVIDADMNKAHNVFANLSETAIPQDLLETIGRQLDML